MRELFLILITFFISSITRTSSSFEFQRRILHQPLFPDNSTPPPGVELPPPPPVITSPPPPDSDRPFFPEVPTGGGGGGGSQDQPNQSPPGSSSTATPSSSANGSIPIPAATQPAKPAKKVAIAISVGIVTLGMLSALAFFLYRHRASKHSTESQKLVGSNSQQRRNHQDESGVPPSSFLYIGTGEPSQRSVSETNGSPYHKLNSVKRSLDRYRPSPELQPLPQLTKPPSPTPPPPPHNVDSPVAASSSDEESHDTAFYTPQCSSISTDEYYTPATVSRPGNLYSNGNSCNYNVPHSKRTSPRSRIMAASPEMKPVIMPSIKQNQAPRMVVEESPQADAYSPKRPKFSAPPPPPNMELLRSLNSTPPQRCRAPVPPPPPPPPPPPIQRKLGGSSERNVASSVATTPVLVKPRSWSSSPKSSSSSGQSTKSVVEEGDRSAGGGSENTARDSLDGTKPKLKALHWDKVRATSDRATVWDQLKSSSFQ